MTANISNSQLGIMYLLMDTHIPPVKYFVPKIYFESEINKAESDQASRSNYRLMAIQRTEEQSTL